jgi:hypothetical protein
MLGLHVSKNNNPDNRACLVKCSWSSYFTGVNPVKTTSRRPLIMCEGSFCSGSKEPAEQGECASTDVDRNSAWNLRQRLSPKAQPWDSGNTDQENRQALSKTLSRTLSRVEGRFSKGLRSKGVESKGLSASLERVAMLIPSKAFLSGLCASRERSERVVNRSVFFCVNLCPNYVFLKSLYSPHSCVESETEVSK